METGTSYASARRWRTTSRSEWRLLLDPAGHPGAWNMAVDETLLADAARSGASTLRLYRWSPACLSFGRNEPAGGRYDRGAIERLGLDVVRRPTGGRAVWHDAEVTYAVAAPVAAFGSLAASYRAIHERLADALRSLGVRAELATPRRTLAVGAGACFASPVGGEVLVDGRKVVGSAQVRCGTAFLQHGSILLAGSQDVIQAVSRQPSAASAASSVSAALGRCVGFDEVAAAVLGTWGEPLTPSDPPPIRPSVFSDPAWTWRR
jgi:lipoyl(octanoyl) transferase